MSMSRSYSRRTDSCSRVRAHRADSGNHRPGGEPCGRRCRLRSDRSDIRDPPCGYHSSRWRRQGSASSLPRRCSSRESVDPGRRSNRLSPRQPDSAFRPAILQGPRPSPACSPSCYSGGCTKWEDAGRAFSGGGAVVIVTGGDRRHSGMFPGSAGRSLPERRSRRSAPRHRMRCWPLPRPLIGGRPELILDPRPRGMHPPAGRAITGRKEYRRRGSSLAGHRRTVTPPSRIRDRADRLRSGGPASPEQPLRTGGPPSGHGRVRWDNPPCGHEFRHHEVPMRREESRRQTARRGGANVSAAN